MKFVRKIDEQGIFIEDTYVEEINENCVETPIPNGMYAVPGITPKWDGEKWAEVIAKPEIAVVTEPTESEMIMLAIAELDAQRELDKTETELAIAELAETLLGGM